MLPEILEGPKNTSSYYLDNDEPWKEYYETISSFPALKKIDKDFIGQICYEHYNKFNEYFPNFGFANCNIIRRTLTAENIYDNIKYDNNEKVDFWSSDFDARDRESDEDDNYLYKYMTFHLTWNLAPVVIDNKIDFCSKLGSNSYGKPYHLVEGTHRVSYLNRMYELKKIERTSKHELIVITSKE